MKTLQLLVLIVFTSLSSFAQSGINYKALIKDTNGNVIANQGIDMVFIIEIEGTTAYSELQQIVTDANGIAIATIGVGSVISGDFNTINWKRGDAELNVQIDFGNGLVDFGNSPFNAVPYAIEALNKEGLEAVDEGNGVGWRIIGRNPQNHGSIGIYGTDLSYSSLESTVNGATGTLSLATGANTIASGFYSTALGIATEASELGSTAMGNSTIASGLHSTAMGDDTTASGFNSTAMGFNTQAESYASTAIGRYNVGGGNPSNWNQFEPLFEIGNGSSSSDRSNALTVYKNGRHFIRSSATGLNIVAEDKGIFIFQPGDDAISISQPDGHGIRIVNPNENGIVVIEAENYGGVFLGNLGGVYGVSSNNNNPDVILGGNSFANDNGVLASDPDYPSSDIFLRSNDAVVVALDNDNNESGQFLISNGNNNYVFEVDENGNISHSGTITSSSDRRLKKDIEDLSYGLTEVLQLQPKQYFWKDKEQDKKSLGLIAQEVQPIIDEIVNSRDDEMQTLGVSYIELIPVLINAIKEQHKIIQNEKAINTKQNLQLEALLSRIEILESSISN